MLIWDIELTGSKYPLNDARTNTSLLYEMNKTIETFIFSCLGNLGEKQIWRKESGARKEGGKQRLYRCWWEDPEEGLFLYDEGWNNCSTSKLSPVLNNLPPQNIVNKN